MNLKKLTKTPEGVAFLAAFTAGVIAHLFGLINVVHNYDSIHYMPYGQGSGIYSGRFTLSILGGLRKSWGATPTCRL